MLPQHGGVPNFRLRINGLTIALLTLVLMTGVMLTVSFHLNAAPGDFAAQTRVKLSLIITILLSFFILLVSTERWWHPHLRQHSNSQLKHRHRHKHGSSRHRRSARQKPDSLRTKR